MMSLVSRAVLVLELLLLQHLCEDLPFTALKYSYEQLV